MVDHWRWQRTWPWFAKPRWFCKHLVWSEQFFLRASQVDQIYHLACPASPVHYKFNPVSRLLLWSQSDASVVVRQMGMNHAMHWGWSQNQQGWSSSAKSENAHTPELKHVTQGVLARCTANWTICIRPFVQGTFRSKYGQNSWMG